MVVAPVLALQADMHTHITKQDLAVQAAVRRVKMPQDHMPVLTVEHKIPAVAETVIQVTDQETHHQEGNYKAAQEGSIFLLPTTVQAVAVVVATMEVAVAAAVKAVLQQAMPVVVEPDILAVSAVELTQTAKAQDNTIQIAEDLSHHKQVIHITQEVTLVQVVLNDQLAATALWY